jgi:hypothetical protein
MGWGLRDEGWGLRDEGWGRTSFAINAKRFPSWVLAQNVPVAVLFGSYEINPFQTQTPATTFFPRGLPIVGSVACCMVTWKKKVREATKQMTTGTADRPFSFSPCEQSMKSLVWWQLSATLLKCLIGYLKEWKWDKWRSTMLSDDSQCATPHAHGVKKFALNL